MSKGGLTSVSVNGVEWSLNTRNKEKPCEVCKTATKGRIKGRAICSDHGMAEVMKPIGNFRDSLMEFVLGQLVR